MRIVRLRSLRLLRPNWPAHVTLDAVLTLAMLATAAGGQELPPHTPPLPLARVVLFSSSVGFFEHRGQIEGDRQVEFAFKSNDINDLLKSLVVQDHDGGLVTAVSYGSPEPVSRALGTLAIDLTETPSLAEIFQQLRGQRVQLESPAPISGTVVGVETRVVQNADKEVAPLELLHLRTEQGLESIPISSIKRTRFLDPQIDREFQQALDILAADRRNDQKRVQLDFRGAGQRQVSVAYIQEAPVWKTSYRLVLADDQPPFLQGWAIVENTTAQDWRDVQLTLVSGRPISFLMDLYQPLFLPRPFVTPEQHAALRPRVYDQDLASRQQEFEQAATRPAGRRGGVGGMAMGGAMMGGMGGEMGGGMGGGMGSRLRGGFAMRGGDTQQALASGTASGGTASTDMDLTRGVAVAASAEDVGELFRYVITAPVTLARSASAMLPIVNAAVQGEKVAIYNPAVHAKHPLCGLRLKNTTPLHLLQGPITLFDGGEYAGDARIEDIAPGSTRLISYALDLETEVAVTSHPAEQEIAALQIKQGGLHVKHKATRKTEYVVKNSSGHSKQLLIERVNEAPWRVAAPTPAETTRTLSRFSTPAEPGRTLTLTVVEERDDSELHVIGTLAVEHLQVFQQTHVASVALRKSLDEAITRRTALANLETERKSIERRIADLSLDQERIRRNLQALNPFGEPAKDVAGDLLNRLVAKLADQESELERQRTHLNELRGKESQSARELETWLQSLIVE